jgi:hypothetical protein
MKPLFEIEISIAFVAFNIWFVLTLILLFVLICLLMTFENLGCHTTEGMQPPRPDGSHQRTPPSSSSYAAKNRASSRQIATQNDKGLCAQNPLTLRSGEQ